jgi:hypothetical protein
MHSHGGFAAYASTTDEDDEAELDGLHVVVLGTNKAENPATQQGCP